MIKDIRRLDDDRVAAEGPRFDLRRVLETMWELLERFTREQRKVEPGCFASLQVGHDGPTFLIDEIAKFRFLASLPLIGLRYDADGYQCQAEIGSYRLLLHPFGADPLFVTGEEYHTIDGGPAEGYDPTPLIAVVNRGSRGDYCLDLRQRIFVTERFAAFATRGVSFPTVLGEGLVPPMAHVHFPHEVFGAGVGRIRIRCV